MRWGNFERKAKVINIRSTADEPIDLIAMVEFLSKAGSGTTNVYYGRSLAEIVRMLVREPLEKELERTEQMLKELDLKESGGTK